MENNTEFLNVCHVREVQSALQSRSPGMEFEELLSSSSILEVAEAQGLHFRKRCFSPDLTVQTFLSQNIRDDSSCQSAVARVAAAAIKNHQTAPSLNTAAYCKARERLPEEILFQLFHDSGNQLEADVEPNWLWRGRHVKLVDGSTILMWDTSENQALYPQQRSKKAGTSFPQARLLAVFSCATGATLELRVSPCRGKGTGEIGLLRLLLDTFQKEDVVLGDAIFNSYFLFCELQRRGQNGLFPMQGKRLYDFRKGTSLARHDHLVVWHKPQRPKWMNLETYRAYPKQITVREVKICSEAKGFRSKQKVFATTFLDPKLVGKEELGKLYGYRWFAELNLRIIKQIMHMDFIRAKTPSMVRKEIWVHLLAYNLIRKLMARSARTSKRKPSQLSFKFVVQLIEAFAGPGYLEQIIELSTHKVVGNRPNRQEPRAIKTPKSHYNRLRKHRSLYKTHVENRNGGLS